MYSEEDINSAVAAGALSADAAASFRSHMSTVRALPRQSEENFRLLNSFNDIFVAIGIVILLLAVGAIGQSVASAFFPMEAFPYWDWSEGPRPADEPAFMAYKEARDLSEGVQMFLSGLLVALAAWPLSEFFTRKRRMALPSILLLLAFVGGTFISILGLARGVGTNLEETTGAAMVALSGVLGAAAAYIHWRRFQVPITVAAAAGVGVLSLIIGLLGIGQLNGDSAGFLIAVLVAGLAVFGFAMRWDISDRERITRRSDVAFWLHLLAAPMIAHPIFALIGVNDGANIGVGAAVAVLGVYVTFGLIALAIDRRALLVSALAYVLFALTFLFREFGAVEFNFALTALVIGSALLSLSAFWQPIRSAVVGALPEGLQALLPEAQDVSAAAQQAGATV
ncbi:MAG: hypothetical protein SXU28_11760 [Pseudomonadota bacterium]|nr:hypothetical protein [Pseudomonadota bacterium]